MPTHLPGLAWIQVLVWPVAAWGALRIVTGWEYRPLPVRHDHLGAFAGWLALAGCFGSVAHLAVNLLLGSGPGLMMMLAHLFGPSSGDYPNEVWFVVPWTLANFVVLGTALWIGSWLVRRIDWERLGDRAALDQPKPPTFSWRQKYLATALAAGFLWPLAVASQLYAFVLNGLMRGPLVAAPFVVSLALASLLASGFVDDLLSSGLTGSDPAPPAPRLRQVLWFGAVGLLTTGLSTIPNAILALLPYPTDMDPASSPTSNWAWQAYLWIDLALFVGLSVLMLRLLPKPLAESGPRHALRGIRRLTIAMALASTMVWPLEFLRTLMDASASLHVGSAASRNLLIVAGIAIVIWLLTWRPKVQPSEGFGPEREPARSGSRPDGPPSS